MNTIAIMAIFFLLTGSYNSLDYEQRDQKTGLTFVKLAKAKISYDTYTILYYVDISEYRNLTLTIEKFLLQADKECERLQTSFTCKTLLGQAKTLLTHMQRDEIDIQAYQQKIHLRKKRAIEIIGDFYHWAFGLMNAATAREYEQKIENLQSDTKRLHNLAQEQTILIKETLSLNNKTISDLSKHLTRISESISHYFEIEFQKVNWIHSELTFTEAITIIKLIETEHRRSTQQILRCLEEVVSGKITQLIPEERLINDLSHIEKFLREDQKLPIDFNIEDPLHIFKYSKIMSTLYGNRIFMEITIPIVERQQYTAYEIIPIPTIVNNFTIIIKPSAKYVLLNDDAKDYIPISSKEYIQGKVNLCGERIIKPAENAHLDFSENCEISIFMHPQKKTILNLCDYKILPTSNYFISINSNNLYYLQIAKPLTIMEYCRQSPAKMHEIKNSGLLTLNRDCRIMTDKISLRPRTNYNYNSKEIITLSNHTSEISLSSIFKENYMFSNWSIPQLNGNILIQDHSADFDKLADKADKIIQKNQIEEKWNEIQEQYVTNSTESRHFTIYIALIILIIIIVIVVYTTNSSVSTHG